MKHLNYFLFQVLILSILLFTSSCFGDGGDSTKKIAIVEDMDFWEEVVPSLTVVPGLTNHMSTQDWKNLLSTPSIVSSRMGNREVNFHILENGTFFLERMNRPITFLYSDDFGHTWNGVELKDENDPSFVPYFKEGGLHIYRNKVRISTGLGGTVYRTKGESAVFESSNGKSWEKLSKEDAEKPINIITYKGLNYAKDYKFYHSRNSSDRQNVFDYQKKEIYTNYDLEEKQEDYQYLVVTCDGSQLKFGGPVLEIMPSSRRPVLERNDGFMLMSSGFIYDNIFGMNSGNVDTFIYNFNNNLGISGKDRLVREGDWAYYVRVNNQWIKTNVYLRNSSVQYSVKDKRLYGISDDGRLYRSKSKIKTSCD